MASRACFSFIHCARVSDTDVLLGGGIDEQFACKPRPARGSGLPKVQKNRAALHRQL